MSRWKEVAAAHKRIITSGSLSIVLMFSGASCRDAAPTGWTRYFPGIGTYSSPRLADLNNDGILDIVIGAGGREERHSDTAVMALDGRDGRLLWRIGGGNQFVGSAVFSDIDRDGIQDVIIGGRWAELAAVNGATGAILWRFLRDRRRPNPSDEGWYNFTTAQLIPDQDGDELEDILIANGGDAMKAAGDTIRPTGKLMMISTATGSIISEATVPDGRETYLSAILNDSAVYFGTGGESIGGHLYRTSLAALRSGDISGSKILATGEHKGFISSPVLADFNRDGIRDILINAVDGRMILIDGKTDTVLWQLLLPGTEAYTNPAIGFFNNDSIPDAYCNFAIGVFPELKRSVRFMVDGASGKVAYMDTVKAFQYASAVVYDVNNDGVDELIVNQSEGRRRQFSDHYFSALSIFDFNNGNRYVIGDTVHATNFASTPWIGDMDGDNKLDVVHTSVNYHGSRFDLGQPLGLHITVLKTETIIKKPVAWGAYLGSRYSNIFYE